VEVCRRNSEFIGSSDFGRQRVGEILIRAHHGVASKIKRLSRQVRQRLIRIDLRAPLPQDRLKVVDGLVVCIERIRLCWRGCGGLTLGGGGEDGAAEIWLGGRGGEP